MGLMNLITTIMNKPIYHLVASLTLLISSTFAQSISVTPTGVDIGNTTPGTAGTLLQQSGQTTTISTQDGTTSTVRLTVLPNGNVGVGTTTPTEKLSVSGNSTITGSATVGSLTVGSSPIFTVGSFESAEQAIPAAGVLLTVPHGLGGVPRFVTVSLRCKISNLGWQVDDEILLNSILVASSNNGFTVGVNGTNIKYMSKGSISMHTISPAGNWDPITNANWRLVFRAWR